MLPSDVQAHSDDVGISPSTHVFDSMLNSQAAPKPLSNFKMLLRASPPVEAAEALTEIVRARKMVQVVSTSIVVERRRWE